MDLTEQNKAHIDGLSYEELLSRWRFAPVGDPWFQDETGKYWGERMNELRAWLGCLTPPPRRTPIGRSKLMDFVDTKCELCHHYVGDKNHLVAFKRYSTTKPDQRAIRICRVNARDLVSSGTGCVCDECVAALSVGWVYSCVTPAVDGETT